MINKAYYCYYKTQDPCLKDAHAEGGRVARDSKSGLVVLCRTPRRGQWSAAAPAVAVYTRIPLASPIDDPRALPIKTVGSFLLQVES